MSGVTCSICPHSCRLRPGEIGICGARQGQVNRVAPLNYGKCTALALDPIIKKPLARFHPDSQVLSYGSFGCNLRCEFCQNWEIAQTDESTVGEDRHPVACDAKSLQEQRVPSRYISPEELIEQAMALRSKGSIGIALTYNEPLICPEYCMDVAELAHEKNLKLVLVTNGYVMSPVAEQIFTVVDAANIDLKAFRQEFYTMVGAPAGLATVKRTIRIAHEAGCHVEVSTLIIPGLNDSPEEMAEEAAWLASLTPELPLHITAFHPAYKMRDTAPTSPGTVYELACIAHEHLANVYVGNV